MTTTPTAKERVQEAGGTAAEETKHVGAVAKDELSSVAGEAKGQARTLVNEALSQVSDQGRTQKDRLVSTLTSLSDDLESMASQSQGGLAADLTRQVASRARGVVSQVENREPAELLDDLRSFARRKPGTFLLGALAAGVVAGRLARGVKEAQSDDQSGYQGSYGYASGRAPLPGASVSGYSTTGTDYTASATGTTGGTGSLGGASYGAAEPAGTGLGAGTDYTGTGTGTGLPTSTGTVATGPTGATGPATEGDFGTGARP